MKKLLVVLCLLAWVTVPALADHGWPPIIPPATETKTVYGTPENPLGWGTWIYPAFSDYAYVEVRSDLTSIYTSNREVYLNPRYVYRNGLIILHTEENHLGDREVMVLWVETNAPPDVFIGHISDTYYTGWIEVTWVR